jgi:hypothetical protein
MSQTPTKLSLIERQQAVNDSIFGLGDNGGMPSLYSLAINFTATPEEISAVALELPAPGTMTKADTILSWREKQVPLLTKDPSAQLFLGTPTVFLRGVRDTGEDVQIPTTDPLILLYVVAHLLRVGATILGPAAPQRLQALAAWAVKTHKVLAPIEAWRQPVREYGVPGCLADTLDYILGGSASAYDRGLFEKHTGFKVDTGRGDVDVVTIAMLCRRLDLPAVTETWRTGV